MTLPASSLHSRLTGDARPVSMFPLKTEGGKFSAVLGVGADQMHSVGDHILSAKIDVPPGEWVVWVEDEFAMWIGSRVDAIPAPVRRRQEHGDASDIAELLDAFADVGVWLREAALCINDGWTPSRRADRVMAEIDTRVVSALSGIFVDRSGRSARLEMTCGGVCWTDHPTLAIQWLLTAEDLPAPQ